MPGLSNPQEAALQDLLASSTDPFEASLSGIPFTSQTTGTGFGILSGTSLTTSRTIANTVDLICEGQIEGLVSGEYLLSGSIGATGYNSAEFISFGEFPENELRSIYLNETPVTSEGANGKNYYNFQNFHYAISDGEPEGITPNDSFLLNSDSLKTQKTRNVSERIYGPEADGTIYPKSFRIINTNLSSFLINIKIPALSFTKAGDQFSDDEQNQQVGTLIQFNTQYRPIYKNGSNGTWEQDNTSQITTVQGLMSNAYIETIKTTPNYNATEIVKENLIGWEFQITRTTLDSINAFVQNESFVDSVTEVFQTSLSYPNSAVIGSRFEAEFFSQIPNRAFDVRMLKVKIPSNYDPITRTYHDDWDGSFSTENGGPYGSSGGTYIGASRDLGKHWTDNPAWIFYDLVTNKRYGLGKYIETINIDKWSLYKIAQYCDVLVDNGEDGVEPRFSANVYINSREEAFKVLQDFASIFRGIIYYGFGNINAIQDREKDPVIQFTNANVKEGNFSYSSTAKKTRFSVAVIRYNDKENFYKPAIEYVEDVDAIRKYGVRETEVTAFGCTSKSQAVRLGRWILHTNNFEQETVNFSAGMESLLVKPGDLIRVADKNRGLNLKGGRAIDISQTGVILDTQVDIENGVNYSLTLTNPTYFYDTEQISSDGTFDSSDAEDLRKPQINKIDFNSVSSGFTFSSGIVGTGIQGPFSGTYIGFPAGTIPADYNAETGLAWSLDNNVYDPEYYNVIDVKENADLDYDITATKHYSGKYAAIESGIKFTPKGAGVGTADPPPAPTGFATSLGSLTTNSKKIDYTIGCPTNLGTTAYYEVFAKTGAAWASDDFIAGTLPQVPDRNLKIKTIPSVLGQAQLTDYYVPGLNNAEYYLLVQAYNSAGLASNYVTGDPVNVTDHFPIKDVSVHSLRLTTDDASNPTTTKNGGIGNVVYPNSKDQTFTWDVSFANGTPPMQLDYRVTIREPIPDSALTGTVLEGFSGVKSRTFDFPFTKNFSQVPGGPYRHYDIAVEAHDSSYPLDSGYSTHGSSNPSAGYDIVEVNNQRPSGYWLTPRHYQERGARPGICQAYEDLCTEQIITSDGKIRVQLRQLGSQFNDIVGGHIYLSAQPFSSGDFSFATGALGAHSLVGGLTGVVEKDRRENTFGATTSAEQAEYQILKIPFVDTVVTSECLSDGSCGSNNGTLLQSNTIVATANFDSGHPLRVGFDRTLYMALSLFDSYDYARSGAGDTDWNLGQWIGFARPYIHTGNSGVLAGTQTQQNQGFYTGTTAASTNASGIFTPVLTDEDYIANPTAVIPAPYFQNTGDGLKRSRYTGFSAVPVFPTKFTSAAGLSPFHAWIRLNVNGQWEGNGISRVRMLTAADVDTYYNFNGFFEFSCSPYESPAGGGAFNVNSRTDSTRCRFTQGQVVSNKGRDFKDNNLTTASGLTGKRVGNPLFWQSGYLAGSTYSSVGITDENIPSYNETGAQVYLNSSPTINATRPLHGFRRYRVYFDENNLPPASVGGSLAGYSIVGLNAWNGKYESWPGNGSTANNLLFEKEGTDIFSANSVQTWLDQGELFENIPGVWNHHPAGFGQGFGGLIKTQKYFDVHLGRLIDDSYLEEALFAAVATTDYGIQLQSTEWYNTSSRYDTSLSTTPSTYVHAIDGYTGLGLSDAEATALSGWYKQDGPTRGWEIS